MRASVYDDDPPIQGQRLGQELNASVASISCAEDQDRLERLSDGHCLDLQELCLLQALSKSGWSERLC